MSSKEEILEAADRLFGEMGYDAATTREIAQRSGVNKALIHYHFKSKEALFESVLDRYYLRLGGILKEAVSRPGKPRERLWSMIDAYVDFLADNENFSRIVQRESSGGKHVARVEDHLNPLFELGVTTIQQAYPKTRKGPMAAPHLLISFYGLIVAYFSYAPVLGGLMGADPLSQKELAARKKHLRHMLDIVLSDIEAS